VLSNPSVVNVTSSIDINTTEISCLRQLFENIKKMFLQSSKTANKNYRTSKASTSFVSTMCVGLVTTPPNDMTESQTKSSSGQSQS
jgi:hypothetical protein